MAMGIAGSNGVVSLGDGGSATLTFDHPIVNGDSWDFAVFENSFDDWFLELAFVEVSSDGIHFHRFPATSLTDTNIQIGAFDSLDTRKINNLAGKYRALYGTPFDLEELKNEAGLDVNHITHVRIVDVVGSLQNAYATHDSAGIKINDPWPTAFASCGFDLDAVGVIWNTTNSVGSIASKPRQFNMYPNPANETVNLKWNDKNDPVANVSIYEMNGRCFKEISTGIPTQIMQLDIRDMPAGVYFVHIKTNESSQIEKLVKL
jgi:hypothetical protein